MSCFRKFWSKIRHGLYFSLMNLLKNGQFTRLWANQILLQTGFNMANFTILLLIDSLTSSRFALAQFYAALTIPSFLVGMVAGAIVDTSNRKWVILVSDAALAILFLAYAFFTHSYWFLLTIAFLSACVAQVFTPAESATLPKIVKKKDLEHANALFLFTGFGSVLLGYGLAGPVIQLFGGLEKYGDQSTFIIAATLTAIGFVLSSSLTIEDTRHHGFHPYLIREAKKLTREVLETTRRNTKILLPIILLSLMQFCIGLLAILFIDFVKTYLHLPSTATSYFLVIPLGFGLIIGVYLLKKLQKKVKRGRMIYIGSLAFGLAMLLIGLAGDYFAKQREGMLILRAITTTGAVVSGISAVFIAVHSRTILQQATPPKMLGRVFSLVYAAGSMATPVPILLIALITEKVDVAIVFIIFGVIFTATAQALKPTFENKLS